MNKFSKLRDLLKICILFALLLHFSEAYSSGNGTYRTNFCLCQMDVYLLKVRQMLSIGQVPPATPPTTTPGPSTTNAASTTTNTQSTATSGLTTATGLSTSTTQAAIGKRRKREAGASTTAVTSAAGTGSTANVVTKKPTTAASVRKISLGLARDYISGISTPTFGVVFDASVKLVDDHGVIFDSNYNPSLCPCATNQTVEVALCLLNVPYNSSYDNINSTQSHGIVGKLLPWLDDTLIKAFNSNPIYIRVLPQKIQSYRNKSAQIVVTVNLRNITYQPDYYVNNAINPSLTVVIQPADIIGYQVDNTQTGCYSVVDVTPAIPVVRSATYYLRFLAIPVALAVLGLMIFCTCCGSRDQFYLRFW